MKYVSQTNVSQIIVTDEIKASKLFVVLEFDTYSLLCKESSVQLILVQKVLCAILNRSNPD
jgi:hypothetical protein